MVIDWPDSFQQMLDELVQQVAAGDEYATRKLDLITAQLTYLEELDEEPKEDTATLKRVRQSSRYPVWRLAHPYRPNIAVRTIVWFMDSETAVVALFAGDKAHMGDVFYDSVGSRADQIIDRFKQEDQER